MRASFTATDLDSLIWYRRIESMGVDEMCQRLMRTGEPNEKMLMGTAFHSVLENPPDEIETIERDGFIFVVDCDAEITIPQVREIRASKTYQVDGIDVTISGGCDGITGNIVTDHKLTFRPNPENYTDSYQWRVYLDIFGADVFEYIIYHGTSKKETVTIKDISSMRFYRYPGMVDDVERGIRDLLDFVKEHLPERITA